MWLDLLVPAISLASACWTCWSFCVVFQGSVTRVYFWDHHCVNHKRLVLLKHYYRWSCGTAFSYLVYLIHHIVKPLIRRGKTGPFSSGACFWKKYCMSLGGNYAPSHAQSVPCTANKNRYLCCKLKNRFFLWQKLLRISLQQGTCHCFFFVSFNPCYSDLISPLQFCFFSFLCVFFSNGNSLQTQSKSLIWSQSTFPWQSPPAPTIFNSLSILLRYWLPKSARLLLFPFSSLQNVVQKLFCASAE